MLQAPENNIHKRGTIIFVCTANICRSPIAEGLLKKALEKETPPLCDLGVISAGTSAYNGDLPSIYSVQVLKKVGIDLSSHKSQCLNEKLVSEAFAIFCMTSTHKLIIENQFHGILPPHLYLLRQWLPQSTDIPDPYGLDLEAYENCRDAIAESMPSILSFLKSHYPTTPPL